MGATPSAVAQPLPSDSALIQVLKTASSSSSSSLSSSSSPSSSQDITKYEQQSEFWSRAFAEHAAVTRGKKRVVGEGFHWGNIYWASSVIVDGLKAAVFRVRRVGVGKMQWSGGVREAGLGLLFMRRVIGLGRFKDDKEKGGDTGIDEIGKEVVDAVVGLIGRLGEVLTSEDMAIGVLESKNGATKSGLEMWSPKIGRRLANNRSGEQKAKGMRSEDKERIAKRFEVLGKLLYCAVVVLIECLRNERWRSAALKCKGIDHMLVTCMEALLTCGNKEEDSAEDESLAQASLLSSISLLRSRLVTTLRLNDTVFSGNEKTNESGPLSASSHFASILHLIIILGSIESYQDAMCGLITTKDVILPDAGKMQNGFPYSNTKKEIPFARLYECLGTLSHGAAGIYFSSLFIANHRRFRTFVLARTDPEVLVLPILEHERLKKPGDDLFGMGSAVSVSVLLMLTEDVQFCKAISVENGTGERCLGVQVLYVVCRSLQSAVIDGNAWVAHACVALMANVSYSLNTVDSATAERLVSLIDVLAKRHKKLSAAEAVLDRRRMWSVDVKGVGTLNGTGLVKNMESSGEVRGADARRLYANDIASVLGGILEIVLGLVSARGGKGRNRNVYYTLLHRGSLLRDPYIKEKVSSRVNVVVTRLRALVEFLEVRLDAGEVDAAGDGLNVAIGLSVESVFEVIERYAPRAPKWIWEGLPKLRYHFEKTDRDFGVVYAASVMKQYIKERDGVWEWNFGLGKAEISQV